MKQTKLWTVILLAAVVFLIIVFAGKKDYQQKKEKSDMMITSPVFENNGKIPAKYTCLGEDFNPPLEITGVPMDTKSLALIVDDPDAPMGTWVHWVVYNINPEIDTIEENSMPKGGINGMTSAGEQKYGGPCPPSGTHRYFFKLYALSKLISVSERANKEEVFKAMDGFILSQAQLVGLFSKK